MNPKDIYIEFYAGKHSYEVGKTEPWLVIVTDPVGLSMLGKIDRCLETSERYELRLNTGSSNTEQTYVRDEITSLALSKHGVGENLVRLTSEDIQSAIQNARTKMESTKKQLKINEENRMREIQAKKDEEIKKQKALDEARELLKDEIVTYKKTIERLEAVNRSLKSTVESSKEELYRTLIEEGEFEVEDNKTVTTRYRIVCDDEE